MEVQEDMETVHFQEKILQILLFVNLNLHISASYYFQYYYCEYSQMKYTGEAKRGTEKILLQIRFIGHNLQNY